MAIGLIAGIAVLATLAPAEDTGKGPVQVAGQGFARAFRG